MPKYRTSIWPGKDTKRKSTKRTTGVQYILISPCPGSHVLPWEDVYFYQCNPISTNRVWDASKGQFSGISHVLLESGLPKVALPISHRFMPNNEIHLISIFSSTALEITFQTSLGDPCPESFSPRLHSVRAKLFFFFFNKAYFMSIH